MKGRVSGGAVILEGSIPAFEAVRSLGGHHVSVAVVHSGGYHAIAPYSLWAAESHLVAGIAEQPSGALDLLEYHDRRSWKNRVLFPAGDAALELISRHHDRLFRWCRIAAPQWETVQGILN